MAYRTTDAAVRKVTRVRANDDTEPFIEAANALVTEVCATVVTYDAARLELIERWLAAHFYRTNELQASREEVQSPAGGVRVTYLGKVDLGFDVTIPGQQALRLDTNGGLAALNAAAKGRGRWSVKGGWVGYDPAHKGCDGVD